MDSSTVLAIFKQFNFCSLNSRIILVCLPFILMGCFQILMLKKLSSGTLFLGTKKQRVAHKYWFHRQLSSQISTNSQSTIQKDSTRWIGLMSGESYGGQSSEIVLRKASLLYHSGWKPDAYTLVHLTRACTYTGMFSLGEQLHCHILRSGLGSNVFISTALVNFYVKFELFNYAHLVFAEIPEPSVVSWNSLISGYVHCGRFRRALELFAQLEKSGIYADSFSITAALSACGQLRLFQMGRTLHTKIVKHGSECSIFVANCLIDMYGKCGYVAYAAKVFEGMVEQDTVSWNSFLSANARNGKLERAFSIFHEMPYCDIIAYNELINGIAQFGVVDDAIALLAKMPNPNSSSWNSIIAGCVNRNRGREALEFFCKMHSSGICMDEFTFSSILSGIASLSAITWGKLTHCCLLKNGLDGYVVVGTALIDMYLKCGLISEAERLFQFLPETNLVTWNSMISGYANNSHSTKAIQLFQELKTMNDLEPDEITFLNVLLACLDGKIPLQIATQYLEMMLFEYRIHPMPEHCSLMIRLMGQEGDLNKASMMIHELGYENCGIVWKTLLGASVTYGDIKVAEVAAKKVIELEGDHEFVYVLLSNMYACHRKWEDVGSIRKVMNEMKVGKACGFSWIDCDAASQ